MALPEPAGPPLESLLERHLAELESYVQKNMGAGLAQRESCEDLVQSICREVLQSRERFEFQGEAAFRKWLLQAALRKLIDRRRFYRARKRDQIAREADLSQEWQIAEIAKLVRTLGSPSGEAMLREDISRLAAGLDRLTDKDRGIIRMIHIDGLTHGDVAERLGCTESQSRGRLFLALARLSAHLKAPKP
ncbi:MAG: sigma-70 family RNA polymerase sigma factor [Planctomycetes bacterium]|jgi:RNA polymerase sigma factor (sigma-70 family)|nr:sigma-70 family RNA polymerase sigma factor [Planctomycetota bacterium]